MNITRLGPDFFVAPQIRTEDVPRLKEAGFRAIVNNRPDGEEAGQPAAAELQLCAEQLGLRYAHLPIVPGRMTDDDARRLASVIEKAGGPVLAFCRTGTRSANLWKRSRELGGPA